MVVKVYPPGPSVAPLPRCVIPMTGRLLAYDPLKLAAVLLPR